MALNGLYVDRVEHVVMREDELLPLKAGEARIRVSLAAMKHGTLFHHFSGKSPFEKQRFDPALRLFVAGSESGHALVGSYIGNMFAGTIMETGAGISAFRAGEKVFGFGPACDVITRSEKGIHALRPPMTEEDAVCMDPALVAYAAVRDAKSGVGDNVAVFGLGAIGLFVVQLLKLNGCSNIIAVDPIEKRRAVAGTFGATHAINPLECDVGERVREILGVGADISIEASGNYMALAQAMRAVRQCGRIVTLGYYKGKDSKLELGAEWLHNRLEMICSLPDWNNPLREHPVWDRGRLWKTLISLFQQKKLVSTGIVDPVVSPDRAPDTFMSIYKDPSQSVKMGIRFC